MSDTTFTDTPLWSTETVRKLITILLPHRGEKFDRWYVHEINKAYQLGYNSYKEFFESVDPYERYQYLMPLTTTEIVPEVIERDNMKLFDSLGAREHIWQDNDDDYWYWSADRDCWEWSESLDNARACQRYRSESLALKIPAPFSDGGPYTRVERVS